VLRAADRTNSAGDAFVKLQARGRQATVYPPEQFTLRDSSPSGTVYSPEQFLRAGLCLAQELLLTPLISITAVDSQPKPAASPPPAVRRRPH
jgi:hypothetical protein